MRWIIESEGIVYGPFATDREAAEWALNNCATPWRLRSLHFIPPRQNQDAGD